MTPAPASQTAARVGSPLGSLVLLGTGAALSVLSGVGQVVDAGQPNSGQVASTAALAIAFIPLAAFVLARLPGHVLGRLMAATGVSALIAVVAVSWSGWLPAAWASQWAWWPPVGFILITLLLFPDGRLPSRRWRPVAVVLIAACVVAAAALAAAAAWAPRTLLSTVNRPLPDSARLLLVVARGAVLLVLMCLVPVLVGFVARWRRADTVTRHQLLCLALATVVLGAGIALEILGIPYAGSITTAAALPAGISVAVLRYRLYDLDLFVNRALVWAGMTAGVVAGYAAVVTVLSRLVEQRAAASLLTAGLIAVAFEPARRRVQRGVDRLLYGERNDPYRVLTRLGGHLERTVDPAAVLPLVASTVTDALRMPYAAVEVEVDDGSVIAVEHGRLVTAPQVFPMVAHGIRVGRLLVAPRRPGEQFSSEERRLLENLALQAAVAAEACRFTLDLQRSRERLVLAREEERRRLRRDLHDGVGPVLAGMTLQIGAAQALVSADPGQAQRLLGDLEGELRDCVAEVRRVVQDLRPPALDDLGLLGALRQQVQRFATAGPGAPGITLAVPEEDLAGLPAAVEVAAYRISVEATTNVIRHASAESCTIRLRRQRGALEVEVRDDGIGVPARPGRGVGTAAMRERAAELGGTCTISACAGGGTLVRARLPLPEMQGHVQPGGQLGGPPDG